MDTIIKNGTILTDSEMYRADIGIEGEKIVLVGRDLKGAAQVIDASGDLMMCNSYESTPRAGINGLDTTTTRTMTLANH